MERSKLSLKWLEVFQAVARSGSVQAAARRLEISISTVSHHLACLEDAVGVALIDHGKRPMKLTQEGDILLARVDDSLMLLRKGISEVWSKDPAALIRSLRIAMIEDLDTEVTPALAASLSAALPACSFSFLSRPSHDILTLLQSDEIDLGIASAAEFRVMRLTEAPLLRDPYVLVVPKGRKDSAGEYLGARVDLPFLRYSRKQLMGRRIEAQLRRQRIDLPSRLEFESTPAILSLIAEGEAWTVTTALNVASSDRHHDRIAIMPLPGPGFARRLSIFRAEDLPQSLFETLDRTLRPLLQDRIIAPMVAAHPWLADEFRILNQ
ncbi:LysR family transcriptional regulator [Nioella sp. MMSF_3534]|jgi:DNA-binding transcriptional LysR family regulator|uniref:LysR family transcriptional regulator n=1 Tax=Nioella sp. MMSF_3534 TaxID=3046720 RepID=UPI00273E4179|nr:LysR family transcriptional regulator [Nioella sp. MMSF_3534]